MEENAEIMPELLDEKVVTKDGVRRQQILMLVFIIFTTLVIGGMSLVVGYIDQLKTQSGQTENSDAVTWQITRIDPDQSANNIVTLTVGSNEGDIKKIRNVRSFGLSPNREEIAIVDSSGLYKYNFNTDTRVTIDFESGQFVGSGGSISWSRDSQFFVMPVANTSDISDTHILVYSRLGSLVREIELPIYYEITDFGYELALVKKSPTQPIFLIQTYADSEKGSGVQPSKLQNFITAFKLDGSIISTTNVGKYDRAFNQLVYDWNSSGEFLMYKLIDSGQAPNFVSENGYTQILIRSLSN